MEGLRHVDLVKERCRLLLAEIGFYGSPLGIEFFLADLLLKTIRLFHYELDELELLLSVLLNLCIIFCTAFGRCTLT